MRLVVDQIEQQYKATFEMLRECVETCPDSLWEDRKSKPAYWHEAYHTLFWCDNFVGDKNKAFERCPVGVDIDPRLSRTPVKAMAKDDLLHLLSVASGHVAQRLAAMADADLSKRDDYSEGEVREFDIVLHRMLYALRHGQHHVGKLAGRLWANGASLQTWRG